MIAQRFHDSLSFKGDVLLQLDVGRRCSHLHYELSRSDVPLAFAVVRVITELLGIQF